MSPSSIASSPTIRPQIVSSSIFRPFPTPQTGRQWFYLGFLQGFGAGIIDGCANFGIAYAMYHGQKDVRMWVFSKSTVAGDLGVTPIVQCLVSMMITSTLVHTDLHNKAIPPLPFVWPHVEHLPDPRLFFFKIFGKWRSKKEDPVATHDIDQEKAQAKQLRAEEGSFKYYYWMLVRFIFEGTEMNMLAARPGVRNWFLRVLWTAAQGALIGIVLGFPCWCLAMVILGPIYGTGNMGNKWAPQAIKAVYGAIVGWITNPVIAAMALGSQAEHHLVMVPIDDEGNVAGTEDGAVSSNAGATGIPSAIPPTIPEDGELPSDSMTSGPPSPFLRPYRATTTGTGLSDTPSRGRSSTMTSSSGGGGRSRAGSFSYTAGASLTPTRSSSGSISVRAPLTANAANLSPALATDGSAPAGGRARGLTVSSFVSSSTTTSYAYALGGTGGRAKRVRSNTVVSTGGIPSDALSMMSTGGRQTPAGSQTPARPVSAGYGQYGQSPLAQPAFRRERAGSDVAGGAAHAAHAARGCDDDDSKDAIDDNDHVVPIEHAQTLRPSFDVFGQTGAPVLTIQRPSMDANRPSVDGAGMGTGNARAQHRDSKEGPLREVQEKE